MSISNYMLLADTKLAMRISTSAYDNEIISLIEAAKADLGIAGVIVQQETSPNESCEVTAVPVGTDPIVKRAVITYCRMNFGSPEDYDRLKASYDEQKAQLMMHTGHTRWEGRDDSSRND